MNEQPKKKRGRPPKKKVLNFTNRTAVTKEVGRHTILTREVIDYIIQVLENGNYVSTVIQCLGIEDKTWYNWIHKGNKIVNFVQNNPDYVLTEEDNTFIHFVQEVKRAQGVAITANIDLIKKAALKNWVAAAWLLERRHPELYSLNTRVQIENKQEKLEIDEIRKHIEEMKQRELDKGN